MSAEANEIVGLYRRHAQAWTTARGARLVERSWFDRFRALLPPTPTVLDLGCGSGVPVGRYFVEHRVSVTGVDSAPEMIALFEKNLPDQEAFVCGGADQQRYKLRRPNSLARAERLSPKPA